MVDHFASIAFVFLKNGCNPKSKPAGMIINCWFFESCGGSHRVVGVQCDFERQAARVQTVNHRLHPWLSFSHEKNGRVEHSEDMSSHRLTGI
jgi:hypothetical protein